MEYNPFTDLSSLLNGSSGAILALLAAVVLLFLFIIMYVWEHLRNGERLKYEFITIVAHKFRTPLTHVKWLCDSLISEESDPYKKQNLEDIMQSNQKLIDLTATLIELTDSNADNRAAYAHERLSLTALVREAAASFKDLFHGKNVFVSVSAPAEDIFVKADRTRLDFVLKTILENAYIYTPPGKKVDVTLAESFHKAVVTIKDDGIGIAKSDLPNIFLKFFRAGNARKTDTEGLGVGLFLAASVIKRLGGKIEASSEGPDLGSTFTITLPRSR